MAAAIVCVIQLLCAVAGALHPLQDGYGNGAAREGWPVVAAATLCAWPAAMGVRGSRGRQVFLAASAVVLSWVLAPAHLFYVALSVGVSAAAGCALRRISTAMSASRSKAWAERGRLLRERRRLRRDLHDLLGYTLSAVVVQAELLNRRLVQERGTASPEAAELVRLGRQALAEVRALSAGAQQLSLAVELVSVQRVLAAADVRTVVKGTVPSVMDPEVEGALAAVLREGATNILRHSRARSCRITLREAAGQLTLHMSNDGYEAHSEERPGTGLRNLAERVAAAQGTLTWSHDGDRFQLRARCPAV